jgi:hypothetical protein
MKKFFALVFATVVVLNSFATDDSTATVTPAKVKVKYHGLVDAGWSSQSDMVTTLTLSREVVINEVVDLTNHQYRDLLLKEAGLSACTPLYELSSFVMDSCNLQKISAEKAEVAGINKKLKLRFSDQKLDSVLCLVEKSTGRVLVKMSCGNFVHYTLPAKVDKVDEKSSNDQASAGWLMHCCNKHLAGLLAIAGALFLLGLLVRNGLRNQRHSGHPNGRPIVVNMGGPPSHVGHSQN